MRTQIWSSGGGVQSSAIAALIVKGELKPELACIVDTEREASTTWAYLDEIVKPELLKVGCDLVRIPKSDYATVDLYRNDDILIPAFTENGKLLTFCSNEWKQRVMRRWASDQGVIDADIWIGFTIDELRRVTTPTGKWQNRYPLIEKRMTRGDCIALVESMGWPAPPRSSCWMCPNKTNSEWLEMKKHNHADFEKAVVFEQEIRLLDDELTLSNGGQTLDKTDFNESQDDLFTGRCDSGMCFV